MTVPDPLPARRNQIPRGIFYMVLSTVMFAGVNAIIKWEVALYPIGEVAFFRSAFAFFAVCGMILPRTGLAVLRTNRYREHLQRGLSQFGSMTCMFMAFRLLSLGSAIAISFSAPLFTTLLSIVILKEKVGVHRWSALIVGFIGVLVVTHPGAGTLTMGAFFALANAVLFGTVTAGVRGMTATESTETLTMYQMLLLSTAFTAMLPFGFRMPTGGDALIMLLNGLANAVGQYWWTRSLHLAPTAAVAPFQYLSLVWALIIGFAVWGDVPTASLLIGSAIVVGSGIFLFWRESRRAAVATESAEGGL